MKRGLVAAVSLGLLVATRTAGAQVTVEGTLGYNIAAQARASGASTFGAAKAFEQYVLPSLSVPDSFVFRYKVVNIANVTSVPARCGDDDIVGVCNGHATVKVPVSLLATQMAVGYRSGALGLFYTGSVTQVDFDDFSSATMAGFTREVNGFTYANPIIGPVRLISKDDGKPTSPVFDFVAGGSLDLVVVNAYAGYLGSKGFFTNVSQDDVRLAVTTIVGNELKTLNYLHGGFDKLPLKWIPGAREALRDFGMMSLYGQRVLIAPPRGVVPPDLAAYQSQLSYALTTFHLEQLSIARLVDFKVAASTSPQTTLSELSVGFHTRGYHKTPPTRAEQEERRDLRLDFGGFEMGGTVGLVTLPKLPYFGVTGGPRLALEVEVRGPAVALSLQRNNPDILAVFPYAYDAWALVFTVGASSQDAAAREEHAE